MAKKSTTVIIQTQCHIVLFFFVDKLLVYKAVF